MVSLSQIKNVISGKAPGPEGGTPPASDNRIDRVDQCKAIWYQWKNELGTGAEVFGIPVAMPNSFLSDARSYDISNHIQSFTYSKSMGGGAGSFQLTLENSYDWSRFMKPGQWINFYLTGDGTLALPQETGDTNSNNLVQGFLASVLPSAVASILKPVPSLSLPAGPSSIVALNWKPKLRCMGIIQRVGIRSTTTVDGVPELSYVISGKDFGTIYEETELWFNASNADGGQFVNTIRSISTQFTRNLTDLLDKWYDIFLNPSTELVKSVSSIQSFFPEQWVLPEQMIKDLGLALKSGGKGCFGDLENVKEFNATIFENTDPLPLTGLQGRCWDRLKSLAEQGYHELFTELSDAGNPKIIFRPTPWAMDKSKYPVIGSLMLSYKDLANPAGAAQPLSAGTIATKFTSFSALSGAITQAATSAVQGLAGGSGSDKRDKHAIGLNSIEVEGFDVGPDYHSRANFFLADSSRSTLNQLNSFALVQKFDPTFPFRDLNDIKRHGFKPMFVSINTPLTIKNAGLFGNTPEQSFVLELNAILKDFFANAEDYYSGVITLAAAKNSVKLGKVFVTDGSFQGIANMVFYIEGYTDTYSVNGDGTGTWTQSVNVTRGISEEVLTGNVSSKDKAPTHASTFHPNTVSTNGDDSLLGKVKSAIKDPTSLF